MVEADLQVFLAESPSGKKHSRWLHLTQAMIILLTKCKHTATKNNKKKLKKSTISQ